jgi:hypothetical protein
MSDLKAKILGKMKTHTLASFATVTDEHKPSSITCLSRFLLDPMIPILWSARSLLTGSNITR